MESEKIYNGQVSYYNIQKHYGFIKCGDNSSYYFSINIGAIKAQNIERRENKLPKLRTKFQVGDEVNFKIRASGDRYEAYDIEYLCNNQLQQIVNEAKEKQILCGYLKQIDDEFFVKHLSTYVFIPLKISEFEIDIDVVYTRRLNQIVQFKLVDKKIDKLTAILIDRKLNDNWYKIKEACDTQETITGYVKSKLNRGLIVEVYGFDAFLPNSQIAIGRVTDVDMFVGETMELKVKKYDEDSLNVILSRKVIAALQLVKQRKQIISKIKKGQVFEGVVKNIVKYGVFVDLGGIAGLIHITNLSREKVTDPKEIVTLGQKLKVVILDFDEENEHVSLGLKQLT